MSHNSEESSESTGRMTIKELHRLLSADILSVKNDVKASMDEQQSNFDTLNSSITSLRSELTKKIDSNTSNIQSNTDANSALEKRVDTLETQLADSQSRLKEAEKKLHLSDVNLNHFGQRERRTSMKLNSFEVKDEAVLLNSDKLGQKVFTDLLLPIYKLALNAKRITALPTLDEAVEIIHYLPLPRQPKNTPVGIPTPEKNIPQIQVRFRSIKHKQIICDFKKAHLTVFNGANGKTHLQDDRTPQNGRCMAMLRADQSVDEMSVQICNSRIRFKKKGSQTNLFVKNPFASTVADAIKWSFLAAFYANVFFSHWYDDSAMIADMLFANIFFFHIAMMIIDNYCLFFNSRVA